MQLLCTHKIGVHSATPSHAYPVIRLPRQFKALAGETARIYQTEHGGNFAFVITVDKPVDKVCANQGRSQVEARLYALETVISELKSTLLLNEADSLHKNKKQWARPDSNRRPPPCEGDFRELEPLVHFF
ncbi:MAG: hypothetical protein ACXV7G_09495 [Halobacteriota archaeon]